MAMTTLLDLSMAEASDLLSRRDVSSRELTEAVLGQVEATEPAVHAYATVLGDQARQAADRADAGERTGPLHGIPIAVKDVCDTAGIPTEVGSRALQGRIPAADAGVVERLSAAGAVMVGKTVTHEFAVGVNTPPTRSPWEAMYYPGGSSTGSAVAVAARSAYGAIGTDSGGSIRIPASINGIVGLKPTFGRVTKRGVFPLSSSLDHVGPLTRTVEDCALLLQAIAGHDPADPSSVDVPPEDYRRGLEAPLAGTVIGVERSHAFYEGVTGEVAASIESVIADLTAEGCEVVEVELPDWRDANAIGLTILLADTYSVHHRLLESAGALYDRATRLFVELGALVSAWEYIHAHKVRTTVIQGVSEAFTAYRLDALVAPTLPVPSVRLDAMNQPLSHLPDETPVTAMTHHTYLANVTGQPALSVPCGVSESGIPIGAQLIGRPFREDVLLNLAAAYERRHAWHATAPPAATAHTVVAERETE